MPIEALSVGETVLASSGAARPIRWIGRRHLVLSRLPDPEAARPVRVAPGAFADGMPARDLVLSPDHAVYIAALDALVPMKRLVNGVSIAYDLAASEVTYFHLELDRHDVILAEGLPAESWLDTGNRYAFENAPVVALVPDFGAFACAYADHRCARLRGFHPAELHSGRLVRWTDGDAVIDLGAAAPGRRVRFVTLALTTAAKSAEAA